MHRLPQAMMQALSGVRTKSPLRQVHGEVLGLDERGAVDDDPFICHPIGSCSTLYRVDRQFVIDGDEDPFTGTRNMHERCFQRCISRSQRCVDGCVG